MILKLDEPWDSKTRCIVYDKQYIACSNLANLLREPHLSEICNEYVAYGPDKKLIHLVDVEKCIELATDWPSQTVAAAMEQLYRAIEERPIRKRISEEVIPQKKVRKFKQNDMSPWIQAYFEQTKQEAIEQFKKTPEYRERCAQVVREHGDRLKLRLEQTVREELKEELRPIVEAELTRQSQEYRLKLFQLEGSQK